MLRDQGRPSSAWGDLFRIVICNPVFGLRRLLGIWDNMYQLLAIQKKYRNNSKISRLNRDYLRAPLSFAFCRTYVRDAIGVEKMCNVDTLGNSCVVERSAEGKSEGRGLRTGRAAKGP